MTGARLAPLACVLGAAFSAALGGGACGTEEHAVPRDAPDAVTVPRADPAGRMVVASVNGEPVYDDCVARQAAALSIDRDAAVQQCIDFELLAQEALRRGLATDPEVAEAGRTEMVRQLVDTEFTPTLDEPSDIPDADIKWLWDSQLVHRYNKPERRRATYCRVPTRKSTAPGSQKDQNAHARAEQIYRTVAGSTYGPELFAAQCALAALGKKVKLTTEPTDPFSITGKYDGGGYAREFAEAAFSVAGVGQMSAPVRTQWGWDIVLVTEVRPPETRTLADAEEEIREMLLRAPETGEYRVRKFLSWIHQYTSRMAITVHPEALPADGAELAAAPGAAR